MNSTLTGAAATYLAQVRAKLSDLPPAEREDVLDDVASHLTEVAGEFEAEPTARQLEDRLGTPQQYADELRTAAGYPPRGQQEPAGEAERAGRRALRWGLVAATVGPIFLLIGMLDASDSPVVLLLVGLIALFGAAYLGVRALRGHPPEVVLETSTGRRWADRIHELIAQIPANWRHELVTVGQPIWWALRGMVGGGGIFAMIGGGAATVVAALAGAIVSIWIGRKSQQNRRWLWYVVPLNLVALVVVPIWLALSFAGEFSSSSPYSSGVPVPDARATERPTGLSYEGEQVENLYLFDAQGKRLENVRVYNQSGTPIMTPVHGDCALDEDQFTNVFPRPVTTLIPNPESGEDECRTSTELPFVAPGPATPAPSEPTVSSTPTSKPTTAPKPSTSTKPPGVTLTVSPSR